MSKSRKHVRNRIRSELSHFNLSIDTRKTRFIPEKSEYEKMLELKRNKKLLRDRRKQAKFHIGKRRDLRKFAELELEYTRPFD